ncbi:MAG: hypothetical protein K2I70_05115 [Bacilli bacterium]|nr:hypothetical protein [Bacilli bacterium]
MKKFIILFITMVLLTGCYNYHELETLGITSSILFDYVDDKYNLTIEIIEDSKPITFTGEGKSISEALERALRSSGKLLSYYHLNTVILTKNVDIKDILFYLIRNPQVNNTFYIVLTNSTNIFDEKEDIGKKISDILKRNKSYTFFELSKTLVDDKIDLVLPVIGEDLSVQSMMPFSKFKLTKEMELDKIEIYRILLNESGSYIEGTCPDAKSFFEINTNQVDTKIKVKDKIMISIDLEASISEFNCNIDTTDVKNIKKLQDIIDKKVQEAGYSLINELKDNDADILGFNRYIYQRRHNLDKDWQNYDYEIDVQTHINKKGLILK